MFAGAVNTEVACGANANEAVDVLHAGHKSPVCKMCYTSNAQYTLYKRAGGTFSDSHACVYMCVQSSTCRNCISGLINYQEFLA